MEEYSIADLKQTGTNEFRTVGTGSYYVNRMGRRVENTVGVNYIPTKVGKFSDTKWYQLMDEAVIRENQQDLLARIEEACRRLAWLKTDKERHVYALGILASEAYLYWPEWNGAFFFHFDFTEENNDSGGTEAVQGEEPEIQEADCSVHEP